EPDICWMAYRYFGDPHGLLPTPSPALGEPPVGAQVITGGGAPGEDAAVAGAGAHVFTAEGGLYKETFRVDTETSLERAIRRCLDQERRQITATDLFAGLVRRGDLTRFALLERKINPDVLYTFLRTERGAAGTTGNVPPAPAQVDSRESASAREATL